MYPDPNVGPLWEIPLKKALYSGDIYGVMIPNNPLENLINTFGTLLGVHPFVPVNLTSQLN